MNEAKIKMNKVKKDWLGCKRNELGKKKEWMGCKRNELGKKKNEWERGMHSLPWI